eukprot:g3957.t1
MSTPSLYNRDRPSFAEANRTDTNRLQRIGAKTVDLLDQANTHFDRYSRRKRRENNRFQLPQGGAGGVGMGLGGYAGTAGHNAGAAGFDNLMPPSPRYYASNSPPLSPRATSASPSSVYVQRGYDRDGYRESDEGGGRNYGEDSATSTSTNYHRNNPYRDRSRLDRDDGGDYDVERRIRPEIDHFKDGSGDRGDLATFTLSSSSAFDTTSLPVHRRARDLGLTSSTTTPSSWRRPAAAAATHRRRGQLDGSHGGSPAMTRRGAQKMRAIAQRWVLSRLAAALSRWRTGAGLAAADTRLRSVKADMEAKLDNLRKIGEFQAEDLERKQGEWQRRRRQEQLDEQAWFEEDKMHAVEAARAQTWAEAEQVKLRAIEVATEAVRNASKEEHGRVIDELRRTMQGELDATAASNEMDVQSAVGQSRAENAKETERAVKAAVEQALAAARVEADADKAAAVAEERRNHTAALSKAQEEMRKAQREVDTRQQAQFDAELIKLRESTSQDTRVQVAKARAKHEDALVAAREQMEVDKAAWQQALRADEEERQAAIVIELEARIEAANHRVRTEQAERAVVAKRLDTQIAEAKVADQQRAETVRVAVAETKAAAEVARTEAVDRAKTAAVSDQREAVAVALQAAETKAEERQQRALEAAERTAKAEQVAATAELEAKHVRALAEARDAAAKEVEGKVEQRLEEQLEQRVRVWTSTLEELQTKHAEAKAKHTQALEDAESESAALAKAKSTFDKTVADLEARLAKQVEEARQETDRAQAKAEAAVAAAEQKARAGQEKAVATLKQRLADDFESRLAAAAAAAATEKAEAVAKARAEGAAEGAAKGVPAPAPAAGQSAATTASTPVAATADETAELERARRKELEVLRSRVSELQTARASVAASAESRLQALREDSEKESEASAAQRNAEAKRLNGEIDELRKQCKDQEDKLASSQSEMAMLKKELAVAIADRDFANKAMMEMKMDSLLLKATFVTRLKLANAQEQALQDNLQKTQQTAAEKQESAVGRAKAEAATEITGVKRAHEAERRASIAADAESSRERRAELMRLRARVTELERRGSTMADNVGKAAAKIGEAAQSVTAAASATTVEARRESEQSVLDTLAAADRELQQAKTWRGSIDLGSVSVMSGLVPSLPPPPAANQEEPAEPAAAVAAVAAATTNHSNSNKKKDDEEDKAVQTDNAAAEAEKAAREKSVREQRLRLLLLTIQGSATALRLREAKVSGAFDRLRAAAYNGSLLAAQASTLVLGYRIMHASGARFRERSARQAVVAWTRATRAAERADHEAEIARLADWDAKQLRTEKADLHEEKQKMLADTRRAIKDAQDETRIRTAQREQEQANLATQAKAGLLRLQKELAEPSAGESTDEEEMAVKVSLTYDKDFDELMQGDPQERVAFEAEVVDNVADAAGVDAGDVTITGLRPGSVVVDLEIKKPKGDSRSLDSLAKDLHSSPALQAAKVAVSIQKSAAAQQPQQPQQEQKVPERQPLSNKLDRAAEAWPEDSALAGLSVGVIAGEELSLLLLSGQSELEEENADGSTTKRLSALDRARSPTAAGDRAGNDAEDLSPSEGDDMSVPMTINAGSVAAAGGAELEIAGGDGGGGTGCESGAGHSLVVSVR